MTVSRSSARHRPRGRTATLIGLIAAATAAPPAMAQRVGPPAAPSLPPEGPTAELPEVVVNIPQEEYYVDADDASEEEIEQALSAPPTSALASSPPPAAPGYVRR